MELTFEHPVTSREANEARQLLAPARPEVPRRSATEAQRSMDRLLCNQSLDRTDDNGYLTLQYQCFANYSVTNWGFRIAPDKQATVVGGVLEHGWTWFSNGERQSLGARHRVGSDYLFHGTMKPMRDGDFLDYQDYFTWRHNIGSGGTASLTIAGSLRVG
ncbi:MAG: hypothetical protein M3235_16610 [Actinomycetota bacterium]|nr:hypothetical protein [Actinomycetota bacterium]